MSCQNRINQLDEKACLGRAKDIWKYGGFLQEIGGRIKKIEAGKTTVLKSEDFK
jgi:hypothetical protein